MIKKRSQKRSLFLELLEDRVTPSIFGTTWPDPGHLTLSFAPDTTNAGGTPSGLFKLLNAQAPTAAWETELLEAFQTWAAQTNINIGVVSDGGQALGTTGAVEGDSRFGDIRIASKQLASTAVSTASPFSWSGTTWSGDVLLNNIYKFGIDGHGQYDLYTIALHEAGHVFGLEDTSVSTASAMYQSYIGPRTGLSQQDISEIQAMYGVRQPDAFNQLYNNHSFSNAAPIPMAFEADIGSIGEADYYKLTTPLTALLGSMTVQIQTSGLSLLVPSVSVYDASQHLLASASAYSPLNGNLTVTINNVAPLTNYYIKVTDATNSVFGIGSYRTYISYHSLLSSLVSNVVFPLVNVVGNLYNTIQTALPLLPAFGANKPDQRFDYLWRASLDNSSNQTYYVVQAPVAAPGTTFTMHTLAWEMDPNGLHPVVHVFDAQKQPVPVQVVGNSDGMYSIQVLNTTPGSDYYVEVAALNPNGSNSTGRYVLGIKFDAVNPPVTVDAIAGGNLATASSTNSATLVMNQNGLFHFILGADDGNKSSTAVITMSIYDSRGNLVASFDASAGQPPSTAVVYLTAGTYTVRTSVKSTSGPAFPINFWLSGEILSDPIGPYQSDPSSSPTAPSSDPSGGGYVYSGPSSTNTTSSSAPTYY